ncbi:MAG: alkaline phosphatase D family protein, partial [Ilumatobacter sp.]
EVLGHGADTFEVSGHHYALVIVEGLVPDSITPYEVHVDGVQEWPLAGRHDPPSVIQTSGSETTPRLLIGSCRAAAPHEPPYTLDLAMNSEGRGVDTLWAHAERMKSEPPSEWPSLVVFAGDQIYADDSSPQARERIEERRAESVDLDSSKVHDYDEYCWLYSEAWSAPPERWLLSTVPSAMIFDDHDMIDDWNISASWIADMRDEETWRERAVNGMMSYWVHQHLGNLSPDRIREDGMLDRLVASDDPTGVLRAWAVECFEAAGTEGGCQFSYSRRVGNVTVVVVDCRNGRVLTDEERLMVQRSEWEDIRSAAMEADGHVLFVTSLPVFLADGIHDLHVWSQRLCAGSWGRPGRRIGERVRRALDLEDWPAFPESFAMFRTLIDDLRARPDPPRSIVVASGDIHFSYAARVASFDSDGPDVWQIVSSPIRNALIPHERGAMRFSLTRSGARVGSMLRRLARGGDTRPVIDVVAGPFFANNMCEVIYESDRIEVAFEQSTSSDGDEPDLNEVGRLTL